MKNNVISIIVDSVIADYVGNKICKASPTPFVDSLVSESITASRMYSPGPFTDAATRSLFTGRDCLDDYSFYFKYSASPTNHYKIFKENGYETIGIYYPYYITGPNVTRYIDQIYYASGFVFSSEWFGMFSYYEEKAKSDELTDNDKLFLCARLELMFKVWLKFYDDILNNINCEFMIRECIGEFDVNDAVATLEKEYSDFLSDKVSYLYSFLKQGKSHPLSSLDRIDCEAKIDREYLKENVYRQYKKTFDFFKQENFKANWWKLRPTFKQLIEATKTLFKTNKLDGYICLANYYLCLTSFGRMQKESMSKNWQYEQSSYWHFETAKHALLNRKTERPFYLSVHVEEPHNYIACFTYDSQDPNVIREEMHLLNDYVKELNGGFVGDLSYILSIRYVDYQIEKFCNFLKENNLWDNTTILICADHGSSYSFHPLHYNHVNCFDEECYHIPMLIRKPGLKGYSFNSYCNSKDILPTLLDVIGIPQDPNFRGKSLIANFPVKDYVITEYPGGGCPDINSKELWLSIRDEKYVLAYKIKLEDDFDRVAPDTVFDLTNDPNSLYNVASSISQCKIAYLKDPLKEYFNQVKERTLTFVTSLKENRITI